MGFNGDSLPARHNESLTSIPYPLHMDGIFPVLFQTLILPLYLIFTFHIAMVPTGARPAGIPSFTRGSAATSDKVR